MDPHWGFAGIAAIALVLLLFSARHERRWRLIRDLPTSHPGGVFIGLVEVVAETRCAHPLISYLAGERCVHYRWSVDEHWSRTVRETYTDSKGNTQTRTRHESGWTTVASGGEECLFELADESGAVRVDPAGARVVGSTSLDTQCEPGDALYYAKGPDEAISNSDMRRRFHETIIPLGAQLYVLGHARERDDIAAAEIAYDRDTPMFVISVQGEQAVAKGYFWAALALQIGAWLIAVGGSAWLAGALSPYHDPMDAIPAAAIATGGYVAARLVGWSWLVFNGLVELRNRVRQGWSNIEVQLRRRFDLITRLVPIVEAMAAHEAGAQASVAMMRSQLLVTPPGTPGPDLLAASPRLTAVAEAYPKLVAQGNFAALHASLIDCEDRIALARAYFNDIATHWNTRLERFPDIVVARIAHMRRQALMAEMDAGSDGQVARQSAPEVKLKP